MGPNQYQGNHDLISKFRLFEAGTASADSRSDVEQFVDLYSSGPMTKAELLNRMADNLPVDEQLASKFRIKRMGKDKDDLFWSYGKIHGLENIAHLEEKEFLDAAGDP